MFGLVFNIEYSKPVHLTLRDNSKLVENVTHEGAFTGINMT